MRELRWGGGVHISTLSKEGRSQRLKREEANDRNQDRKAIAADNWYLLHNVTGQYELPASCRISVTLAVELAAANDRNDKACDTIKW